MAEEDKEPTETDIFQQQVKTIDTLIDVLESDKGRSQPQQIIYATPAARKEKAPNYILWIGIGIGAFLLLKKR